MNMKPTHPETQKLAALNEYPFLEGEEKKKQEN